MRAWEQNRAELEAIGGQLLILSSDEPSILPGLVTRRGFEDLTFAHARPQDWVALGVTNPDRPMLPYPTTLVLAPDGTELLRETHDNFRERVDPSRAVAVVVAYLEGQGAPPPTTPEGEATWRSPDWSGAASMSLTRAGPSLVFEAILAPGFHLYGSKETQSIPVYLKVDGSPPPTVPPGEPRTWAETTSWVLEGTVRVEAEVPAEGPVSGQVGWQLCTESLCSAPRNRAFTLGVDAGQVIR